MNNYFILQGSFSSPFENWFPWLRSEIENTKQEINNKNNKKLKRLWEKLSVLT